MHERLTARDLMRAVRMRQWAKNGLLYAGFVFSGQLRESKEGWEVGLFRVTLAFACFCALSAVAYLINDWNDIDRDRLHPVKRNRPLASGRMSQSFAAGLALCLLAAAVGTGYTVWLLAPLAWGFPLTAILYFILTLAYSFVLKHEVVVDVIVLASGFVLRVVAGCLALPVEISPWIIFCTFTLALFIGLCKRRAELLEMGDLSASTRSVLPMYTVPMLDTFIAIAAGLTITAYSLYTFNAPHQKALGNLSHTPLLMTTIPFVVYGVFRYLWLAHSSPVGGEPEQMMKDWRMMLNVVLWVLLVMALTVAAKVSGATS